MWWFSTSCIVNGLRHISRIYAFTHLPHNGRSCNPCGAGTHHQPPSRAPVFLVFLDRFAAFQLTLPPCIQWRGVDVPTCRTRQDSCTATFRRRHLLCSAHVTCCFVFNSHLLQPDCSQNGEARGIPVRSSPPRGGAARGGEGRAGGLARVLAGEQVPRAGGAHRGAAKPRHPGRLQGLLLTWLSTIGSVV